MLYVRQITRNAQTILDHAWSFRRFSRHDVTNLLLTYPFGSLPSGLDLAHFDVIVVHYTVVAVHATYLSPASRDAIARFDGLKVQFIQDEYRHVNATIDISRQLGIDVLFTCVPQSEIDKVYSPSALPDVRKVNVLTGYVPEELTRLRVPSTAQRPIDVGYRARQPAYWYGDLGREKWQIAEGFLDAARGSGLACDIASDEASRLYGRKWTRFLTSCKTVLGTESGASVFDFTGEIQRNVENYVKTHPRAEFDEVKARFFAAEDGRIRLNQISPRCFEAAALRTGMVLFEGEYSGILAPWRHYIPLCKDFSNIDVVLEHLRNPALLQEYADRTFDEVARNPAYSYAAFVERFDDVIEEELAARSGSRHAKRWESTGRVRRRVMMVRARVFERIYVAGYSLCSLVFSRLLSVWLQLPEHWKERIRPMVRPMFRQVPTRPTKD